MMLLADITYFNDAVNDYNRAAVSRLTFTYFDDAVSGYDGHYKEPKPNDYENFLVE